MKIGINGFEAIISRIGYDQTTKLPIRVGSGEYVFRLLWSLNVIDRKNEYFIYLPESPTQDLPPESKRWHYRVVKPNKLWTLIGLQINLVFQNPGISLFLSPTHYAPLFLPCPLVISIMDVSYLLYTKSFRRIDLWQLKFWTRLSVNNAKRILTISNASKNDILKLYGLPKSKVDVAYPGIKDIHISQEQTLSLNEIKLKATGMKDFQKKYGIKDGYILFVGTIQPRKNILRLIDAFSQLINNVKYKDLTLIIIGKPGWMYEEIYAAPKKYKVENKIMFLSEITNEELPSWYKNAQCFVFPSLYEGFGLPVLEAMVNGCPVITSNVSSLPEVGGEAAIYVNPESTADLLQKLNLVLSDKKLRENMIRKGYEQAKKFSWEKTARETLKILENVVNKN
jgi:glycosyltransferase involved in cell wall biosynthesis